MSQSMKPTTIGCILVALFFVSRGQARTLAVGPEPAYEFTMLQAAIDAACPGDTIVVADGTYTGAGNRDLDFRGKAITVRSANGPDNCRIDCQSQGRGFSFHRHENRNSTVDGFTIVNGQAGRGGGVCCVEASSPTISNCVFEGNVATQGGGGIYVSRSNPILSQCIFCRNRAGDHDSREIGDRWKPPACGGAVLNVGGAPTVAGCRFRENLATASGGAVCNAGAVASFTDCVFTSNEAGHLGGAIAAIETRVTATSCVFCQNTADGCGGAIGTWESVTDLTVCHFLRNRARSDGGAVCYRTASSGLILDCTFLGNAAEGHGGAVASVDGSGPDFVGCILARNSAGSTGGAIDNCNLSDPGLINCLMSRNDASVSGGALSNRDTSHCVLQNCTISDNLARDGAGAFLSEEGCRTELTNCIVWGNTCPGPEYARGQVRGGESTWRSCCVQPDLGVYGGTDSAAQDPLFVAGPLGDYYLAQVAAGQAKTSPCCDAGAALPQGTDFAGRTTRTDSVPDSGRVDIGYHYPALRVWLLPLSSRELEGEQP
jgi:predicted outer membrane repeat protein